MRKNELIKSVETTDKKRKKLEKIKQKFGETEHLGLFFEKNKEKILIEKCESLSRNFDLIKRKMEFDYKEIINNLEYEKILDVTLKPTYKLVIGLGEDSTFGTSITIHHTYGCPYIKSSAIKGVFKTFFSKILSKNFEIDDSEIVEIIDKIKLFNSKISIINLLFGADDNSGVLMFLDSFPNKEYKVVNDNIAPHYKHYYGGKGEKAPIDGKSEPIFFPIIQDTEFNFCVGIDRKRKGIIFRDKIQNDMWNEGEKKEMEEFLEEKSELFEILFKKALFYEGIGAKTSSGYGAMIKSE